MCDCMYKIIKKCNIINKCNNCCSCIKISIQDTYNKIFLFICPYSKKNIKYNNKVKPLPTIIINSNKKMNDLTINHISNII